MGTSRALVRRHNGAGRRGWWILALSVFLVFDIALVAIALHANSAPTATDGSKPSSTASASTTPAPSAASTPTAAPTAAMPQRLLAAVSADVAWRGVVGACPAGLSELEYTDDGGESWATVDPAGATGANTLVRMIPVSSSEARVVTLDGQCSPQLVGTFVAGEAWEDYSSNLGSYWYVNPADQNNVHTPEGTVKAPCSSVVAMATRSSAEAIVLCADQTVHLTTDGGAGWSVSATVHGAVAVDDSSEGYVIAVSGQGKCTAISIVLLTNARASSPVGCVGGTPEPGRTALAAADDGVLWLWTGDTFARSNDGGTKWG